MTRREMLTMAATAATTFAVAMASFAPGVLDAGGQEKLTATIQTPKLTVDGAEFSIGECKGLAAGGKPSFEVVAENPGQRSVEVDLTVQVTAIQPVSPFSRTLPRPSVIWSEAKTIALAPGEKRTIAFACRAELGKTGSVVISLVSGKESVVAKQAKLGEPVLLLRSETANAAK